MNKCINEYNEWIDNTYEKLVRKMKAVSKRSAEKIPYSSINGVHDNMRDGHIERWTNGFWGGTMWLMYLLTEDIHYKELAIKNEQWLRENFRNPQKLYHDVGFMWMLTAGVNYRLHKDSDSEADLVLAAALLASRFHLDGNYIRAWNAEDREGLSIIDCMMNLPLLYMGDEIFGDDRFSRIAKIHADMALDAHVRPDGSVIHIIKHVKDSDEYHVSELSQGYDPVTSCWSRGQAWALYGFTLSYIHSKEIRYLDAAKKIANYFIVNTVNDPVPKCDFRSPEEPIYYDTSAGACAACGMLELAKCLPEYENKVYIDAAVRILKAIEERFCNWEDNNDCLVCNGTEAYHAGEKHIELVYGDYYFVEAIYKLKGGELLFW